ncbi:MAG: CHAT domain-containing protein [Candidatus Aminicenantes bacterium]|nr:CHAT domain-containing protein [Candidatus Aminicenantes bacterium]NIN18312.1 CHAT domain-containing protein [Candidatus Aminicenantes bacterium]NIN42199.1 CHAT domain-containing protein [Candidatus Aminicenantes bacterium]NIN84965.1 CHAT domain-containing protein [Candidatus Aminicenantes bacterium]NIO81161.1 CHAT domain-containing protein [Candidatus Aminicenantes bacterium]
MSETKYLLYNISMVYIYPVRFLRRLLIIGFIAAMGLMMLFFSNGCVSQPQPPVVKEPPTDYVGDQYAKSAEKMAGDGQYKTSNFFFKRAISNYEKSELWQKAINCYIRLGNNYQKLDDVETALGTLNKALNLTKTRLGHQNLELAKGFQRLAFKYLRKKDFDQALTLYQKALSIQLEILGEHHPDVAKTYNSIALVYWNKRQSGNANLNYLKSYGIKLLYSNKEVPEDMEKKYRSMDEGEYKKGELSGARNHFNRSLSEYMKLYGQNKPLFARVYEQIGILYALEGDYENALEYLRKAFNIRLEVYGDPSPEAGTGYLNIGICLRLKEDHEEALKFLNTALTIKSESLGEFHPETADIYCQIGKVYFQRNQLEKALDYFQKALIALVPGFKDSHIDANPPLDTISPKDKLFDILTAKANALRVMYMYYPERRKELQDAYFTYLHLARLMEMMRQGYKSEYYKLFFGEKIHIIYQRAIQTALSLYELTHEPQYKANAFILSERSKAAVLAEALTEARARQFAGIPDSLLQKERELKQDLTHFDTYLQKEYHSEKPDLQTIETLENRYHTLVLQYRQLIDQFESNYEKYYNLKYKPFMVDIAGIQQTLEADAALIEYFIGERVLHIFVLTRKSLEVEEVFLEEDLAQMVGTYNRAIKKIEELPFMRLSRGLYRILMKPVRHLLTGKTKLIIIPDGPLYTIPFESLTSGITGSGEPAEMDFMIKHFAFSYHYSANLWLYSVNHNTAKKKNTFIGFAPVFGEQSREGYVLKYDPPSLDADPVKVQGTAKVNLREAPVDAEHAVSQLPATEEELRAIIRLFESQQKKAMGYFHRKATETNFKNINNHDYSLIHIATHSLKDEGQQLLSGLIFSPPEEKNKTSHLNQEDGILYSGEIYNLNLDAELIVLSSCESGVGKLVKGEGMMALNRGFFYSGIRNIIVSLWKVEDRSTSRLMIAFYRNILRGRPYCRALQKAKLELIKDPYTAFPKYWSGFVLVGK